MFTTPEFGPPIGPGPGQRTRIGRILRSYVATDVATAVATAAITTAVAALLAGCGALAPSARATPTAAATDAATDAVAGLPAGVTVELRQTRADVALRQAAVAVRNGSGEKLTVGEISVADPRFAAPAERVVERTSVLAPGAGADLRVQLGAVACDAPLDAAATLTMHFRVGDADAVAVVPIVDTVPFVAALHENECLQAAAERSADIAFGAFEPSAPGEPGLLPLVVTPTAGEGALRIVGIRETNLLTTREVEDSVHRLDIDQTGGDRRAVTVDLPIVPARCDAHAVQEDKRGTVFRLLVEVDGREGSFDLAASPAQRGEILDWVADWCGFGG